MLRRHPHVYKGYIADIHTYINDTSQTSTSMQIIRLGHPHVYKSYFADIRTYIDDTLQTSTRL